MFLFSLVSNKVFPERSIYNYSPYKVQTSFRCNVNIDIVDTVYIITQLIENRSLGNYIIAYWHILLRDMFWITCGLLVHKIFAPVADIRQNIS